MVVIRRAQLQKMEAVAASTFPERLIRYLREHHAAAIEAIDENVLKRRVAAGIARAEKHGLTLESTLTAFVTLMFEFAPDFDRQPAIKVVLENTDVDPDDRMELLTIQTSGDDWLDASLHSNPAAWEGIG
jgi:hypothetical protein